MNSEPSNPFNPFVSHPITAMFLSASGLVASLATDIDEWLRVGLTTVFLIGAIIALVGRIHGRGRKK
jgi:hypothetical protein